MNKQDWELIRAIKHQVRNLPDLCIPPEECFIIIETDGCMDGWGGVCKWKPKRYDPKSTEKPCAYASGKFNPPKSTIDAEIFAVMNSLEALKIYYLDRKELVIRTDCQAIISFFNKSNINKPSRVRWISFTDFVTGLGINVQFEHIDGKDNLLADSLSRLINVLIDAGWPNQEALDVLDNLAGALHENEEHPNQEVQEKMSQIILQISHSFASTGIYYGNPTKSIPWKDEMSLGSSFER